MEKGLKIYEFNSPGQTRRHFFWTIILGIPLYGFVFTVVSSSEVLWYWSEQLGQFIDVTLLGGVIGVVSFIVFEYLLFKFAQWASNDIWVVLLSYGFRITQFNSTDSRSMKALKSAAGRAQKRPYEDTHYFFSDIRANIDNGKVLFDNGVRKRLITFPEDNKIWKVLADRGIVKIPVEKQESVKMEIE